MIISSLSILSSTGARLISTFPIPDEINFPPPLISTRGDELVISRPSESGCTFVLVCPVETGVAVAVCFLDEFYTIIDTLFNLRSEQTVKDNFFRIHLLLLELIDEIPLTTSTEMLRHIVPLKKLINLGSTDSVNAFSTSLPWRVAKRPSGNHYVYITISSTQTALVSKAGTVIHKSTATNIRTETNLTYTTYPDLVIKLSGQPKDSQPSLHRAVRLPAWDKGVVSLVPPFEDTEIVSLNYESISVPSIMFKSRIRNSKFKFKMTSRTKIENVQMKWVINSAPANLNIAHANLDLGADKGNWTYSAPHLIWSLKKLHASTTAILTGELNDSHKFNQAVFVTYDDAALASVKIHSIEVPNKVGVAEVKKAVKETGNAVVEIRI